MLTCPCIGRRSVALSGVKANGHWGKIVKSRTSFATVWLQARGHYCRGRNSMASSHRARQQPLCGLAMEVALETRQQPQPRFCNRLIAVRLSSAAFTTAGS